MKEKVSPQVKERRSKALIELGNEKKETFIQENLGRKETVIFESKLKDGQMHGFTSNYIKVSAPYDKNLIAALSAVTLDEVVDNMLVKASIVQ